MCNRGCNGPIHNQVATRLLFDRDRQPRRPAPFQREPCPDRCEPPRSRDFAGGSFATGFQDPDTSGSASRSALLNSAATSRKSPALATSTHSSVANNRRALPPQLPAASVVQGWQSI